MKTKQNAETTTRSEVVDGQCRNEINATAAEPDGNGSAKLSPIDPGDINGNEQTATDRIAQLAYSYWQARQHGSGKDSAEQDWLRAEQHYRDQAMDNDAGH